MGTINSIDVRIVDFFKRALNYYIKKRTYTKPPPTQDEIWQTKFQNNDSFIHQLDNDLYIVLYNDSILCKLIYFGFEETELSFLKKYLRKGDTFFDIGANIGLYSLYASEIIGETGVTYAFEPTPTTFIRLVENINLNNYKNIKAINIGFSNKKMLADFNISNDGYDAWNSFAKLNQLQNSSTIKVNVETLDSFIIEQNISKIDLVKLDVEGWEKFVLEGGSKLLSSKKPPVFLIEFTEEHAFAAGYYCGELYDCMCSFGFEWYSYNSSTNTLIKEKKKLHYPWENLIAIKNYENCRNRINSSLNGNITDQI